MGLILPNFVSTTGIVLDAAFMAPSYISYDMRNNYVSFDLSIWMNRDAYNNKLTPIESNIGYGTIICYYTGEENLLSLINEGILSKIAVVAEKTQAECDEHNSSLVLDDTGASWLEYWDITYQRFINAQIAPEAPRHIGEPDVN